MFDKYCGVPFDCNYPILIPILLLLGGIWDKRLWKWHGHWQYTSQGMTLQQATVDIRDRERQGLTFTTILRVKSIDGLHISPPFSFQCFVKMQDRSYVTLRKKEEDRLKSISFLGYLSWIQFTIHELFFVFVLLVCNYLYACV